MRKWIALWLVSLLVVAAGASTVTAVYLGRTAPERVQGVSEALPWSMGARTIQHGPDDSIDARGAFINLPVSCGVFSLSKAMILADEISIRRVPNTRRDMDAQLRGDVHIRYTLLHD